MENNSLKEIKNFLNSIEKKLKDLGEIDEKAKFDSLKKEISDLNDKIGEKLK